MLATGSKSKRCAERVESVERVERVETEGAFGGDRILRDMSIDILTLVNNKHQQT